MTEFLSARAFGFASAMTGELVAGHEVDTVFCIASITKVLTFVTVMTHLGRRKEGIMTVLRKHITVTQHAARVKQGTHADLRAGDVLTLQELLYGMMLPSGNDASVAIAEFVGRRILSSESREARGHGDLNQAAVDRFVAEMNTVATRLGCTNTTIYDPHGMKCRRSNNTSTVSDITRIMSVALRIPLFAQIYKVKRFLVNVKNSGKMRRITWRNTNDLLWGMSDGMACDGGKTGWIPNVGGQNIWGTLATVVSHQDSTNRYIVVVLGCSSKKRRFIDTMCLSKWAFGLGDKVSCPG